MNSKFRNVLSDRSTRWLARLFMSGMVAACFFSHTMNAHAYGPTQCAASRFGDDLNCTAGDVSITGMRVIGDTTSCTGGTPITLDLELTINFATPDRWDAGIFISNDGKSPMLLQANGGASSCSVSVLPTTSPFLNLDPNGGTDTCGDGNKNIGGGTGSGIHYMPGVTVACQSIAGGLGKLFIPFVVSWDNQASPAGTTCKTSADPVPNTKAKCNAPNIAQGSVSVIVLPTITNTDGITFVHPGDTTTYTVVITNTTGVTLSGAVFRDPAVNNINVTNVTCSGAGAACPTGFTVGDMQGAGILIPDMPANGSVTFTITATMAGNPPDTLTNTASVTVSGETASADDTDTIVGTIAIIPSNLSKYGTNTPPTLMVFNYKLYNFGASSDTIGLSALSNQGWTVQIRNAADTGTISSVTVPAAGSADFIVKAQVPGGATPGTVDVTTITAISGNDPTKTATATAVTTVAAPLTITPDNTGAGGKGSFVFYDHRVQNNTAAANLTVSLSTAMSGSCAGWTSGIYKADKVTSIATVTLASFGGYEDIAVKVNIPAGAVTGTSCTVTVTTTAGGNSPSAVDVTTVKDLLLYSDPGYSDANYIFPAGNIAYAKAYGTLATNYYFVWIDSNGVTRRTSPSWPGPGALPDAYDIPPAGPLGTWTVAVRRSDNNALFATVNFYVGPDHVYANYAGSNPININTNATIDLGLHDRYNHGVPFDPSGNLVTGNWPTTKDPLRITVTVSGAASIVSTTLTGAVIVGQTVTGYLDNTTGTATITITSGAKGTVTVTPASYNAAMYGSPARDEPTTVTFSKRTMRILLWREMVN